MALLYKYIKALVCRLEDICHTFDHHTPGKRYEQDYEHSPAVCSLCEDQTQMDSLVIIALPKQQQG